MEKGRDSEVDDLLLAQYGIEGKPVYSREEVKRILLELHGRHLAETVARELEMLQLNDTKALLEAEHARSLELLFMDGAKNVKLEALKTNLEESYRQLEAVSRTDFLTNLYNRRTLIDLAENEMKRARRTREAVKKLVRSVEEENGSGSDSNMGVFSIALADVDHFKEVNDTYGHARGDVVLKRIGEILLGQGVFRATDIAGRYGGDEFLFLLPDTKSKDAVIPMGKLLKKVESMDFGQGGVPMRVTLTVGVSQLKQEDDRIENVIARADEALYHAKNNGRNRISAYESLGLEEKDSVDYMPRLHFTMKPVWARIEEISAAIDLFMKEKDPDLSYDVKMAALELTENAVKYGSAVLGKDEIQIDISLRDETIVIDVSNRVKESYHLENVKKAIRNIRESHDPKSLYVARLKDLLDESKPVSGSRLGLLRIAYIGGFELDYRIDGGCLAVQASRRLDPGKSGK